jgi:hypothetical protein
MLLNDPGVSTSVVSPPLEPGRSISAYTDRRLAAWIFGVLWLSAVFIGPGASTEYPNTVSRIAPLFSLLQSGSLQIDQFAPLTIDKAPFGGHVYSDKAPGQMLVALPFVEIAFLAAKAAGYSTDPIAEGHFTGFYRLSVWISAAFTAALFTASAASALYLLARYLGAGRSGALFGSLGFGVCTPAFGWGTVFFSHAMAGGCLFLAFAAVVMGTKPAPAPPRPWAYGLAAGVALGLAVLTEFTAALPGLFIGIAGLVRMRRLALASSMQLLTCTVLGGLPFALALGLYNDAAFGSPFHLGYSDVVGFDGMKQGFFGISVPKLRTMAMLLVVPRRGILWLAPWLVFLPLAWVSAFRAWPKGVLLGAAAPPICYFLINSGYFYWDGGWSTGPRHMIAGTSFACLAFAPLWDAASYRLRSTLIVLAGLSAVISLICASVDMTETTHLMFPLIHELIPRFVAGDVHDAAAALGLPGLPSLLPLWMLWGGSIVFLRSLLMHAERDAIRHPRH